MACGSGNLVIDHQCGLVHGIVLRLIAQSRIWFDHNTHVDELAEGQQVGPGTGHVQIDLDVVPSGIVPVHPGYLGNAHAGEAMCAPLAYRRNGPTTDTRIRDAWPLDLEAWFNDVTHRPDAHRFSGRGNLQVNGGNTRVVLYRLQDRRLVDLQMPVLIACARPESHFLDRKRSHVKT